MTDHKKCLAVSLKLFVVFLVVYTLTWGGHYTSGDGAQKRAWAKAMLGLPGGGTSKYGIGHSLIALPGFAISNWIQNRTGIHTEAALYTLIFVVNGALLLGLIAFYLSHFYPPKRVWWTVGTIGLSTFWWVYTKADFSEALVVVVFFAGFLLFRFGHPGLGALVASLAITIRDDAAILVGVLFIWYLVSTRKFSAIPKLLLGLLLSLGIVAAANWVRYASIFSRGYANETFSNPFLPGIYGILFSAGKSVFLFSPPLILAVICWNRFRRRLGSDAWLFAAVFASQAILYAKWWDWSSDDAWGIRFMVVGVVLMCIPVIEAGRPALALFAAAGILIQLLPVTAGGLDYLMLMRHEQAHRQALYVEGTNRIDFEDIRFNPSYSQINGTWLLMRCLLGIPPKGHNDPLQTGTSLYDSLPPETWRNAAHWDFFWANRARYAEPAR